MPSWHISPISKISLHYHSTPISNFYQLCTSYNIPWEIAKICTIQNLRFPKFTCPLLYNPVNCPFTHIWLISLKLSSHSHIVICLHNLFVIVFTFPTSLTSILRVSSFIHPYLWYPMSFTLVHFQLSSPKLVRVPSFLTHYQLHNSIAPQSIITIISMSTK